MPCRSKPPPCRKLDPSVRNPNRGERTFTCIDLYTKYKNPHRINIGSSSAESQAPPSHECGIQRNKKRRDSQRVPTLSPCRSSAVDPRRSREAEDAGEANSESCGETCELGETTDSKSKAADPCEEATKVTIGEGSSESCEHTCKLDELTNSKLKAAYLGEAAAKATEIAGGINPEGCEESCKLGEPTDSKPKAVDLGDTTAKATEIAGEANPESYARTCKPDELTPSTQPLHTSCYVGGRPHRNRRFALTETAKREPVHATPLHRQNQAEDRNLHHTYAEVWDRQERAQRQNTKKKRFNK